MNAVMACIPPAPKGSLHLVVVVPDVPEIVGDPRLRRTDQNESFKYHTTIAVCHQATIPS
jgi:hypothetical protein